MNISKNPVKPLQLSRRNTQVERPNNIRGIKSAPSHFIPFPREISALNAVPNAIGYMYTDLRALVNSFNPSLSRGGVACLQALFNSRFS
jgi:hypothetical protein